MVIKVVNSSLSPTTSLEGVSRYFRPISSLEEQENRPMRPKSGPLTPLHDAVMDCDEEKVKLLIRSRPEWLNRGDVLGRTPLLHACYWGRSERWRLQWGMSTYASTCTSQKPMRSFFWIINFSRIFLTSTRSFPGKGYSLA